MIRSITGRSLICQIAFIGCLFIVVNSVYSQSTIRGKILDSQTREPLMGVGVYLSGTSIGVVSNASGEYSIQYDEAINAPLVFAYLGYEKIQIVDPIGLDLSVVSFY